MRGGVNLQNIDVSGGGDVTYVLGAQGATGQWASGGPLVVDRGVARPAGAPSHWRAIARNAWSDEGMVEFYVDEVLTLPFTMPGALTGRFAPQGGAAVTAGHRLSLPQA